jgi:hypothetical protein
MLYSGIHQIKVTGEEYWELINVPHDIIIPLFSHACIKNAWFCQIPWN